MSDQTARFLELIGKHFPEFEEIAVSSSAMLELENALAQFIKQKLDQDMNGLLNACYRIDIAEARLNKILSLAPSNLIHYKLASEIIQRQLQKIESRDKYR